MKFSWFIRYHIIIRLLKWFKTYPERISESLLSSEHKFAQTSTFLSWHLKFCESFKSSKNKNRMRKIYLKISKHSNNVCRVSQIILLIFIQALKTNTFIWPFAHRLDKFRTKSDRIWALILVEGLLKYFFEWNNPDLKS